MRFGYLSFIICCLVSFGSTVQAAKARYYFEEPAKEVAFHQIVKQLRCVVCQSQSVYESHAPLAMQIKEWVYEQVQAGQQNTEIMDTLKERYGDYIDYNPSVSMQTAVLYGFPLLWVVGIGLFLGYKKKKR